MRETTDPRTCATPRRGAARGVAAGVAPYVVVYALSVVVWQASSNAVEGFLGFMAGLIFVVGAGLVSVAVLITSLVLAINERTRPYSAGLALGAGIGVLIGIVIWALAAR